MTVETPIPIDFPSRIRALGEIIVRPDEPILIGDVTMSLKSWASLEDLAAATEILIGTSFKDGGKYVDGKGLRNPTKSLTQSLLTGNPESAILLFPGKGAKSVIRETLDTSDLLPYDTYFFDTFRPVNSVGKVGEVILQFPETLEDRLQENTIATIIVIDDVIATGKTLGAIAREVRRLEKHRNETDPSSSPVGLEAISWFCREPTEIIDYERVQSVFRYRATDGWPALNSLSTLLGNNEKSQMVRARFVKRFVSYPYGFFKQLDAIRSLLVFEEDL